MRRRLVLITLSLALLVVPLANAASLDVKAGNGVFVPSEVQAKPGDTVVFTNTDDRAHTVTSAWDDGATVNLVLKPGQSVPITFRQAGTYTFRCVPHSTMQDGQAQGMATTVHVEGASAVVENGSGWELVLGGFGLALAAFIVWNARGMSPRGRAPG